MPAGMGDKHVDASHGSESYAVGRAAVPERAKDVRAGQELYCDRSSRALSVAREAATAAPSAPDSALLQQRDHAQEDLAGHQGVAERGVPAQHGHTEASGDRLERVLVVVGCNAASSSSVSSTG